MNQRVNHEDEQLRRQQICEILDLCLQINGIQKSRSELTGNHPTASCEFDGHIGWISVRIYTEGWTEGKSPDKALRGYITCPDELDQMIRELRELKKDLHSSNCNRS